MLFRSSLSPATREAKELLNSARSWLNQGDEAVDAGRAADNINDQVGNKNTYDNFSDADFYHRIDQSEVANRLDSSAGLIKATPGETTTVLGRWNPDMQDIIENQTLIPKSSDFGANPGGYSILNVDTPLQGDAFWNTYNKPFLDAALQRGDPIYLSTIPKVKTDVIKNGAPSGMYGRELEYLVKNDVKPRNISDSDWVKIKGWFQ